MASLALKIQCGRSPAERNKGRKQTREKTGAMTGARGGRNEDQTAKWDGASRAFKTKMRHLKQPVEMSKKEKQWQV